MGESPTQSYVRQALIDEANAVLRVSCVYLAFLSGDFGYIVMEHIDGSIRDDSDAKLVAAAVWSLIAVHRWRPNRAPLLHPLEVPHRVQFRPGAGGT